MLRSIIFLLLALTATLGCQESISKNPNARILTIGDSMLAWNSATGGSVSHAIERELSEPIVDRSIAGSWMQVSIPYQYVTKKWDWVIVNGGGNDLMFGCGCFQCAHTLDRLISNDGTSGLIPEFLKRIRDRGANVLYAGYLRSPKLITPIEGCKNEGDELEARIERFAFAEENIYFVSMQDVVPPGGITYFSPDLIHPSRKSSKLIGRRLAQFIRSTETD